MCGSIVSPLWCFSSEWALAQHQPGDSVIILTLIQVKCLFWKTGVNKRNELRVLFKYGVFLCKICVCWVCVCVCVCVSERSCTAGSQPPVRLVQTGCESWVVLRYLFASFLVCRRDFTWKKRCSGEKQDMKRERELETLQWNPHMFTCAFVDLCRTLWTS